MFSLRTIYVVAALACATLSSAVPVEVVPELPSVPAGAVPPPPPPYTTPLPPPPPKDVLPPSSPISSPPPLPPKPTPVSPRSRAEDAPKKSVPETFSCATDSMKPIAANLKAALDKPDINKDLVIVHLHEMAAVIKAATHNVQLLIQTDVDNAVIFTYNGIVHTIQEVALFVYAFLEVLIGSLFFVVKAVIFVDISISVTVLSIGGLIAELISVTFKAVGGLRAELAVIAHPLFVDSHPFLKPISAAIGIHA